MTTRPEAAAVLGRANFLMQLPTDQASGTLRSEFDAATLQAGLELATRLKEAAAAMREVASDYAFFEGTTRDLSRAAELIRAAQSAAIPLH